MNTSSRRVFRSSQPSVPSMALRDARWMSAKAVSSSSKCWLIFATTVSNSVANASRDFVHVAFGFRHVVVD